MPHVSKNRQAGKQHHEQYGDPARRAWMVVVVGLLRARYVRRNAHSPSSVIYSDASPSARVRPKLSLCKRLCVHAGISTIAAARTSATGEPGPAGEDGSGQAAAGSKFASHDAPFRTGGFHDVVENLVHGIFVEYAQVPVGQQVHLERFKLKTLLVGHVTNGDNAEVGQAGLGADGRIFRETGGNHVTWELVGPRLQDWKTCFDASLSVL